MGLYPNFRDECLSFGIDYLFNHTESVREKDFPQADFNFASDCGNEITHGFRSYVCSCIGDPWIQEVDAGMQETSRKKREVLVPMNILLELKVVGV